jgi:dethiobiotin synthetase
MSSYFVTGTDTGVGKTIVSAVLVSALDADYWKPVQCGDLDTETVKALTGLDDSRIHAASYSLRAFLAPDQAAKEEGIELEISKMTLPAKSAGRALVVEGAGGILVPLNEKTLVLDLIQQLELQVIVVCRGTLGTINHTLLTVHALKARNIPIRGLVFSGALNEENRKAIEKWTELETLMHVPEWGEICRERIREWVADQGDAIRSKL